MQKILKVENLDCANCAEKMEEAIRKIEGIETASVNFFTQKIVLEVLDGYNIEEIIKEIKKTCKKVEPDADII